MPALRIITMVKTPRPPMTRNTAVRMVGDAVALDPAAVVRLLIFASPAFPTGSFAYSSGLEAAFESGEIANAADLQDWLEDLLIHGAARSDAILLRHAWRAEGEPARLAAIAELAAAACIGRERQEETLGQGSAFAAAAQPWGEIGETAYPVAFGALAAKAGIDEDAACLAFLTGGVGNLISAALRLGVLGQSAGLRVLAGLEMTTLQVADETRAATLEDLGSACFMADIAAMRHETQYSRLFRS